MDENTENPHVAEAVALLGGLSAVGRHYGKTAWAVAKWVKAFPPGRTLSLAELTGWRKTPHELCPEYYPNPDDGLPPVVRARLAAGLSPLPEEQTAPEPSEAEVAETNEGA